MTKSKNNKQRINDAEKVKKNEFAFLQGEKELNAIIEASNVLENKATKFITIFIAVFTVSIGALFTAIFDHNSSLHRPSIIISLILFDLFIFKLIRNTIKILNITDYYFIGNRPKNLLDDENESYNQLIEAEANRYNNRIEENRKANKEKAKLMQKTYEELDEAIYVPLLVFALSEGVFLMFFCFYRG